VEGPGIRSADDWHQIGDVALPMRGIDEVYDAFSSAREAEPRHPDALTASPRSLSHGGQARTRRRLLPTDAGRPVEPRERLQRLTARPAAEFVDCSSAPTGLVTRWRPEIFLWTFRLELLRTDHEPRHVMPARRRGNLHAIGGMVRGWSCRKSGNPLILLRGASHPACYWSTGIVVTEEAG
jgi:hypothetical protein